MTYRFDSARIILHGGGSRHQLPQLITELGGTKVLLVTDPGVLSLGIVDPIIDSLRNAGLTISVFSDVQADPTLENVIAGVAHLEEHGCDIVVGLGGGSPIDTAKVIAVVPNNSGPLSSFAGLHKIQNQGLPLIAIPTTAGTGSEATKVAVISDTENNVKIMMLSAALQPRAAIMDFELTMTMPPGLTAAVGVDTLTHGMEAYVSKKANAMSDPIALSCIQLCAKYLKRAYQNPNDREAREGMMIAAGQGGMAFSNSSVCLVHGMSRPLGAYFHIPHGLSNALLLPNITRYSIGASPFRYATIARVVGVACSDDHDEIACKKLCDWLDELNRHLKIPRLGECKGVTREFFNNVVETMAQNALSSGSPDNNPKVPTPQEIVELYEASY